MAWEFELVAGPFKGAADGPAWDGSGLLFCLVEESRILRYVPSTGETAEVRRYSSGTRGLGFDGEGNLYGCQSESRRMVRFNPDGSTTPMESTLDGDFHNFPDDIAADRWGRVWFSDPIDPIEVGGAAKPLLNHASVLRLEPDANGDWVLQRMTFDTTAPRGLRLSPDERTLYVAESSNLPGGARELRAYPIQEDGTLGAFAVVCTFGADQRVDGICINRAGHILACVSGGEHGAGSAIAVIAPEGKRLDTHPLPAGRATNCVFGDAELRSLYVTTAEGQLYRVRDTGMQGAVREPRRPAERPPARPTGVRRGMTIPAWSNRSDREPLQSDLVAPGLERIVPQDAVLERIGTGFISTEGPVWNTREGCLLWSDIVGGRIYRWSPEQGTSVFMDPSGHSNGLTFDQQGRLVAAGFGSRNIWRLEPDGRKTILADRCEGRRLQAPNDIVVKSDGSIYWTESTGALFHPGMAEDDVQQYLDIKPVLRLAPDGSGPTIVVDDFAGPNGIAFSPDESLLYINDIRRRHIRVFDVWADGSLVNGRVFYEAQGKEHGNPDGMKVDVEGNVYCRASGGIHIIDPQGHLLGRIRIPDMSNQGWGDADWRTLYIAGRDNMYRVRLEIPGVPVW